MIFLVLAGVIVIALWVFFNPKIDIYSKSHLSTKTKIVSLTFDDGPEPGKTDKVLEILNREKIKASFFVVGKNIKKHPDLLKAIFNNGHLICNHSYGHSYPILKSSKKILKDIEDTSTIIEKNINLKPVFYRPPFGLRTPWSARIIRNAGYYIVTWNNMTYDYFGLPSKQIAENITAKTADGGIIVLHDGHEGFAREGHNNMVDALDEIIKRLKEKGFKFVTLDEMFKIGGYQS